MVRVPQKQDRAGRAGTEGAGKAATQRPAESLMLLKNVIEHRCPDLVVPQHRTVPIEEKRKG